jgi:GEVED domain/Secretion system C-terminal sorting domain
MKQKLFLRGIGLYLLTLMFFCVGSFESFAQVSYSTNFNANSTGWTGNITRTTATSACGSASMRRNMYSGATTGNMVSPLTGSAQGGLVTLTYDYKVANWSANTVGTPNPWGSFNVQYGPSATGPWTTVQTIDATNHIVSGTCATQSVTFTPPVGNVYIKWDAFWTAGDYYINFDNVSAQEALPPCVGTPAPGNTISTVASVCVAVPFTLSLQNATAGSGVTYVWESADDAAFTMNVATLAPTSATAIVASQTSAKYYRCTVTCSADPTPGVSAPVFVDQNPFASCYCTPVTSQGCTDGDVIAQVILNTLNNNSGTGCPSGLAGYSDYTTDPLLTTTLVAGNTYGCQVWAGQYSESYAAWIDFNENGVFDHPAERIGFTSSPVAGSGSVGVLGSSASFPIVISCNPEPGTYRLRVRAMFSIAGSAMTPCGANTYGETEDYLVTIAPPLPCPAPTGLTASSPTDASINLSWTAGCTETAWNIEYGLAGFVPGTGTVVAATSTSATVNGLTCNSGYDFYVYADCGGAGTSLASNLANATTTICPCSGTPLPGNTESSLANVCDGQTVNLSLQNDVSALGISYQWESSSDAGFTSPVSLGTSSTQVGTVSGDTWFRCVVTCAASGLVGTSTPVMVVADPAASGNTMGTAIEIPAVVCLDSMYVHTANTLTECYSNDFVGRPTRDVYYTFTLGSSSQVQVTSCNSGFDTYLWILDNLGNVVTSNDDNGPVCSGTAASIVTTLPAGTYFIVHEGYSLNGALVLNVSTGISCNACSFPMLLDNTVTTTSTTANVTWTPTTFPGLGWYEFRYRVTGAPSWTSGGTLSLVSTSKLFSGLAANTSYEVEARVMCSQFVAGPWSPTVTFMTPVLQGCALPPAMTATVTGSSINLSWPAVAGAGWFEFQYKPSSSATWLSGGSAGGAATTKSYVGLMPGTSYDFQARTICSNNIPSAWGGMISATTTALAGCELPPVIDMTAVSTTTSIKISWAAVSGAAWYGFQYKESSSATWISGGTAGSAAIMKTFSSLLPGTSYDFQAKTFCSNGQGSAWSATSTFSTSPSAPSIITVIDKAENDMADKALTQTAQASKVYPNPATDRVNVEVYFSNSTSNASIQLMDMSGRIVQVVKSEVVSGTNTISLDIQELSSGMYTVLVYENGSLIHTDKLKKN